jgi:hypothetical protein
VFAGSYADGRLLGEWRLADAAVAAAEMAVARGPDSQQAAAAAAAAARILRVATSSSRGCIDGVGMPVAAARFDWVIYHTHLQTA